MQKIDVRIPFNPKGNLGAEYNRIMEETSLNWVLFLDHDVFLCNPHWYLMCQKAIDRFPCAGMFTCWTNNLGRTLQRNEFAPEDNNLDEHIQFSRNVFNQCEDSCFQIDRASGFFMLINKEAWKIVGRFPGVGLFKEDWDFSRRLTMHGYKIYRINGLYVFHLRDRKTGSWITGEKTAKELRDERYAAKAK